MTTKRALVCAPRVPEFDRESGSRRVFHLIEFLRDSGWTVCFVAQDKTGGERYVRLLQQRGVETMLGFGSQTDEMIAARHFDLAILAFWHLAEKCIPIIRRLSPKTRIVVDMIDLHFLRDARRILAARNSGTNQAMLDAKYGSDMIGEVNVYAMSDAVLAVSQKEADLVNDLTGDRTLAHVVPDSEDLPASTVPFEKRNGILFIGNFWHQPNIGAAEYLCRTILPRLDPALLEEHPVYIVGNELNDVVRGYGRDLSSVRFVGWVPSLMPYINRARVSVIPLLTGAGTKRKLIQALMAGTPTVSTAIGTEGLQLKHGVHVLVADDPQVFADSITLLLRSAELWETLRLEGRKHVIDAHGRQNARMRLQQAVSHVFEKTPKPQMYAAASGPAPHETRVQGYQRLIRQVRDSVAATLPEDATVMVVSNGDDDFLNLGGRKAWHFPQDQEGRYAGYHPADSAGAITHLQKLRDKGADYLVIPRTSFWWLEYYSDFKAHLESHYATLLSTETCRVFAARQRSEAAIGELTLSKETMVALRPQVPEEVRGIAAHEQTRRRKVLVLGVYLAQRQNNIDDIVSNIFATRHNVTQRWVGIDGEPATEKTAAVTTATVIGTKPKFEIMNELLSKEKVNRFEYVVLIDDDVVLPDSFLDHFISLQERLGFAIAQPARTSNSYIDHPIVEQQRGVLARRTRFVEIGPVVSFHKTAYELVFPFDLSSPMGWGYENVWAYRVERARMKMGIIDAVPVDHSIRKPVAYYSWEAANHQRDVFLSKNEHIPIDECFRVLDVVTSSEASISNAIAISLH